MRSPVLTLWNIFDARSRTLASRCSLSWRLRTESIALSGTSPDSSAVNKTGVGSAFRVASLTAGVSVLQRVRSDEVSDGIWHNALTAAFCNEVGWPGARHCRSAGTAFV